MSNIESRVAQRFPLRAVSFCILLVSLACRGRVSEDAASIRQRLDEKGTAGLMDQVSRAPEYGPPADGRLTERQVRIYLDVRRRERKIREIAAKDVSASVTADLRAAVELGYNPKEYSWIEERVLEAEMLQTTRSLHQQIAAGRQALLASLEEQKRTAGAAQRAEIEAQIRDLEKAAAHAVEGMDPAKEYNAGLIAKYREELEELQKGGP